MPTLDEMIQEFQTEFKTVGADVAPLQQPVRPQAEPTLDDMVQNFTRDDAREQSLQQPVDPQGRPDPPEDKIGFWENIERGGWGGFFDKATLGVKPLAEAATLFGAVNRFQDNQYSTSSFGDDEREADRTRIMDYLEEQADIAERGLTIAAKAGNILGEMLPFMAEFIATGGVSAIGKKAVSKAVLKLVTKATGKAAAGVVGRSAASLAGWVTAAGIRTALTPHRSLQGFIENRMPNIQVSPEGQLIFKESEDSPFRSAYKAIGNQLIEMASEESGAFLGVLAGKITSKLLPKGAITALNKLKNAWMGAVGGRTAQEFAEKMATKVGFNGILEEYSEERLGALMRVVAGIDDGEGTTFEKIGRALYPGNEQAFVELIAFSVPGVVRAGAAQAFSRKQAKEEIGIDRPTSAEERQVLADKVETTRAEAEIGEADAERIARQAEQAGEEVGIEGEAEEGVRVRDVAEGEERPEAPVKPKGRKFAEAEVKADIEALTKPVAEKKGRKKKAVIKVEKIEEKEIEHEPEAIIEPTPSPEVDTGEAGQPVSEITPTGKLDPTDQGQAVEITKLHAAWVGSGSRFGERSAWEGIRTTKVVGTKTVTTSVEYTPEQVDAAYRAVQKSIPSPQEDVSLFAMPGKETELTAIAEKMAKQKKFGKKQKTKVPRPTALPKAKRKVTKEDHIKAVKVATAFESTRFALNGVSVEGNKIIATDGHRLFIAEGKWGKDGIFEVSKEGKLGKRIKGNFPKYQDIIPDVSTRDAIIVDDLGLMWRRVQQASLLTNEDSKGLLILVNKDGSLGFASSAPEVGHSEVNVHPGATILGGVNPDFLLDAIAFHARRGDTSFEFYFQDNQRPILTRSIDGETTTVTMPVNIDAVAAEKKISEGFGAKNTTFTKEQFEKDKAAEAEAEPLRGKPKKGQRKGAARVFTAEDLKRAGRIAGFYFEGGLREFKAWSAKLVEVLGSPIKPHLEKLWAQAKKDVEAFEAEEAPVEEKAKPEQVEPVVSKKAKKVKPKGRIKSKSTLAKEQAEALAEEGIVTDDTYDQTKNIPEREAAEDFVSSNLDDARRIALGDESNVGDLLPNAVRIAYFNKMMEEGNVAEAKRVYDVSFVTNVRKGQDISVIQAFVNEYSTFSAVKKVAAAKRAAVARTKRKRGNKGSDAAIIEKEITEGVSKLSRLTEDKRMDVAQMNKFLDNLEC